MPYIHTEQLISRSAYSNDFQSVRFPETNISPMILRPKPRNAIELKTPEFWEQKAYIIDDWETRKPENSFLSISFINRPKTFNLQVPNNFNNRPSM